MYNWKHFWLMSELIEFMNKEKIKKEDIIKIDTEDSIMLIWRNENEK